MKQSRSIVLCLIDDEHDEESLALRLLSELDFVGVLDVLLTCSSSPRRLVVEFRSGVATVDRAPPFHLILHSAWIL